jgi:hypothetical protein
MALLAAAKDITTLGGAETASDALGGSIADCGRPIA